MIIFSWGLIPSITEDLLAGLSLVMLACYLWERVRIRIAARDIGSRFWDDY